MAGAARGAAEAEDAFVVAVELAALLGGLEPFLLGIRGFGVEPRFDQLVLRKDMPEIKDQVLNNSHIRQRIDRRRRAQVGHEPRAGGPQTPSRPERRKVSVESTLFLIQKRASRTIGPQSSRSTSKVSRRGFSPE